ncbi:hypothetical protein Cob_v004954 [Colletotrichum orbiculare MAFF 240422]|uniref:Zn(2)-C6 fungal-type domain-containing protein n=1 Tax=Colletotrichum orbiculare (strain 104-T / ATCC 96160 / CBS 514.97 / LARS 414 / MAFF 240422) TaxID=1213857 RepID=A0A484FVQ7_COLOR|nr:hypothetical protein Cob_v004954 [Colletotrichum orbiculare MAFF 240422]
MEQQGVVVVNGLSCTHCRSKKVRCSRDSPACDRCISQGLQCRYPQRRTRKSVRRDVRAQSQGNDNETLSLILDRLQRIESNYTGKSSSPLSNPLRRRQSVTHGRPSASADSPSSPGEEVSDDFSPYATSSHRPSPRIVQGGTGTTRPTLASRRLSRNKTQETPTLDVASILSETFDRVRDLRLRRTVGLQAITTEGINIPPELARTWIHNYFAYTPTETFLSLVDRRTIEMIPDMITMKHVTLDACILVVYYAILWRGNYCPMTGCAITDDDRRGMWELIQTDLFYHLIYNKPARLYPSIDSWEVNLPWLSLDLPPDNEAPALTIAFLVRSRLTFVLIHFFQTLEKLDCQLKAVEAIEPLCHEIEALLEEWAIEQWIQRSTHSQMDRWVFCNIALTSHTIIIFMLRKATLLNSDAPNPASSDDNMPKTRLATRASRRVLGLTCEMLGWKFPGPEAISIVLGVYRADVAYAHLASNVIGSPDPGAMMADLDLLDRVAGSVGDVAEEERDFVPLTRVMKKINAEVRQRVTGVSPDLE